MLQELVPCTCGLLYGSCGGGCGGAASSAFSLLFPMVAQCGGAGEGEGEVPVDCTLSLGTPSTRRAEAVGLAWVDVPSAARAGGKPEGAVASCKEAAGRLPARRCANCDTTSTPLWRNGPRGPKSLCNACGIRYKKEERRAAAAVAPVPAPPQDSGVGYGYSGYGYGRQPPPPTQWGCYGHAGAAKSASIAMFGDVDAAADVPCLSWRLSMMPSSPAFAVRESPSLFHYY